MRSSELLRGGHESGEGEAVFQPSLVDDLLTGVVLHPIALAIPRGSALGRSARLHPA